MKNNFDDQWMARAVDLAQYAKTQGEVPIGAVLIHENKIIAEGYNQPIKLCDPTAHAEIIALREAGKVLQNYRLLDTTLYVTLEPCAMCLGAMIQARIKKLVFGAWDPRAGAVRSIFSLADEPRLNHKITWTDGVLGEACQNLLHDFFSAKRHSSF